MKKIWILILVIIIGSGGFIYFSPIFEKKPPVIKVISRGYTNLKNPVKIVLEDDSGIKYYRVVVITKDGVEELSTLTNPSMGKKVVLSINLPRTISDKAIKLKIVAADTSKWNFFSGNEASKEVILKVDTISPEVEIINNSYAIGRGGSGAVVVKIYDEHLKDKYILVNGKYRFNLTPFVKKGYYVALIAWPIKEKVFSADLFAIDLAGNKVVEHIPYYWRSYKYPVSKITITNKFINQVVVKVLKELNLPIPDDPIQTFKKLNEEVRKMNEKEIYNLTSKVYEDKVDFFSINRFRPLPGSAVRAKFGELRKYYYNNKLISTAIHKGIDLAKIKRAKIYASNYGKVVAAKYIGIYGNTLIIYHKLGLYTLYAHISTFKVKKGDLVKKGQVIARTGATGAVFGDHLHFGVYIQGVEVNPIEWMDPRWIKVNIIDVINSSKRLINK